MSKSLAESTDNNQHWVDIGGYFIFKHIRDNIMLHHNQFGVMH